MIRKIFIILYALFLVSINIQGQESREATLLEEVLNSFRLIKTMNCMLSLEIKNKKNYLFLKAKYIYGGTNGLRVEMRPSGDLILFVVNKDKHMIYIKRLNKVVLYESPRNVLTTNNFLETLDMQKQNISQADYDIKLKRIEKKGWNKIYVVEAIPKFTTELISRIEFYINENTKLLHKYLVYDLRGNPNQIIIFANYVFLNDSIWFPTEISQRTFEPDNETEINIKFDSIELNKSLDDSIFNIEIPRDAKVEIVDPKKIEINK